MKRFSLLSRETFLLLNNVLLLAKGACRRLAAAGRTAAAALKDPDRDILGQTAAFVRKRASTISLSR